MIFYTNVYSRGNYVYLRAFKNGERISEKIPFKPSLFVRTGKPSEYKTIFNEPLEKITFNTIKESIDFVRHYREVSNFKLYGNTNYAYQFISKVFPDDISFDMSLMKIVTIDIETSTEYGFPDTRTGQEEVLLITLQDFNTKQVTSFGCKPFLVQQDNVNYIQCADEFDLLRKFIDTIKSDYPDIITGWNVQLFDIAYLSIRISKVLGDRALEELSPHGIVNQYEVPYSRGRMVPAYTWAGIGILDYMDLYKKFSYKTQESYSLDYIAKAELGEQKIKHNYGTFKDFYTKDWQLFTEYNIVDVELVDKLEDKMKLINLIVTMAYDAKCNFGDIYSSVRTWDCIIWNKLYKKNFIIENPTSNEETDRQIMGAYVKDPKPSRYDWVVSFDATSLYPSIMMALNMSPETLMDGEKYFKDDEKTIEELLNDKLDTSRVKDKNYAIAANGQCFTREYQGFLPQLIQHYFDLRQKTKKEMQKAEKMFEETKDPKYSDLVTSLNSKQMAAKILMNSLYGASGNIYFRFHDKRIAEGITMTGQYMIRYVANALNKFLNKECDTKDYEYSFYSDTDSTYLTLGNVVKKYFNDKSTKEKVDLLDKICDEKISKVIEQACKDIANKLNVYQEKLVFKREVIADNGIWLAKKRYALNVYNSEGIEYKEPKLKVQGMEIVRSSTPFSVREALNKSVSIILTKDERTLRNYVDDLEKKWFKMDYHDIAFPRSANNVAQYYDSNSIYKKGTPIHVRGALLFNFLINKKNIEHLFQKIQDGDKIKFLYLKEPNPIGSNVITFNGDIPKEFGIEDFIDYDLMFEKAFLDPMNTLTQIVGWQIREQASLEGLFG